MYEAVTRGIRVCVTPQYLEEESSPEVDRFFWAYTIDIFNEGSETVQLRSRHWRITDADGRTEEVRGPGVVGETPVLLPGKSFRYTSGCPLDTPSGIMVGTYQMTTETGELFNVAIPAFSLDSPHARRSLN
jgi:ApaG protein